MRFQRAKRGGVARTAGCSSSTRGSAERSLRAPCRSRAIGDVMRPWLWWGVVLWPTKTKSTTRLETTS